MRAPYMLTGVSIITTLVIMGWGFFSTMRNYRDYQQQLTNTTWLSAGGQPRLEVTVIPWIRDSFVTPRDMSVLLLLATTMISAVSALSFHMNHRRRHRQQKTWRWDRYGRRIWFALLTIMGLSLVYFIVGVSSKLTTFNIQLWGDDYSHNGWTLAVRDMDWYVGSDYATFKPLNKKLTVPGCDRDQMVTHFGTDDVYHGCQGFSAPVLNGTAQICCGQLMDMDQVIDWKQVRDVEWQMVTSTLLWVLPLCLPLLVQCGLYPCWRKTNPSTTFDSPRHNLTITRSNSTPNLGSHGFVAGGKARRSGHVVLEMANR